MTTAAFKRAPNRMTGTTRRYQLPWCSAEEALVKEISAGWVVLCGAIVAVVFVLNHLSALATVVRRPRTL